MVRTRVPWYTEVPKWYRDGTRVRDRPRLNHGIRRHSLSLYNSLPDRQNADCLLIDRGETPSDDLALSNRSLNYEAMRSDSPIVRSMSAGAGVVSDVVRRALLPPQTHNTTWAKHRRSAGRAAR